MAIQTAGSDGSNSNHSMSTVPTSHDSFMPQYTRKPLPELDIEGPDQPFDRIQLTKLLIDALNQIGYHDSAMTLQKESGGILVESTHVKTLFSAIKEGRCQDCSLSLLFKLPLSLESVEISGDLSHVDLPDLQPESESVIDHFINEYNLSLIHI